MYLLLARLQRRAGRPVEAGEEDRRVNVKPRDSAHDLAIGDHVRVVLHPFTADCDEVPHSDGEVGQTGRIMSCPRKTLSPTHPFLVLFDEPCIAISRFGRHVMIPARHYASDELERLDDVRE